MIGLNTTLLAFSPGFSILLVPAVVFSAGLYHYLRVTTNSGKTIIKADRLSRWSFGNIKIVKLALFRVFERLLG